MKKVSEQYDVVVCGGGLAGVCAAIAAARGGAKTALVQDRPVLGGNSSSEVRVTPHGAAAFHAYARETGILSELLIEERAVNHEAIFENGWTNSVWDMVIYDLVQNTENLTLHLNTAVLGVVVEGSTLRSVECRVGNAEVDLSLKASIFIDCTGDSIVAAEAGCEWRMGSEGKAEFNEPHAPAEANGDIMGNSIHFKTKDMGRPVPFKLPSWAIEHTDGRYFYDQGRLPKEVRGGYWWIEIGVPYDTIHEAETIRHELTRHTLGVWDWIKNKDPKTMKLAENYALDWIGQVPGKRESRRVMGRYLMNEWDAIHCTEHPDEIAFGGWFIDIHTPGGLLAATSEPASAEGYSETSEYASRSYAGPYGVPLRMLVAKDIDNLMMAGRNVSATHCALATVRVMATTALMGQAAGVAAALAVESHIRLDEVCTSHFNTVQQRLLREGCFLPNVRNEDPLDLARAAKVSATSESLFRGVGPESVGAHEGLSFWRDQAVPLREELLQRRGQWVAVGGDTLRSVRFCLSNRTTHVQHVEVRAMRVKHIWDYVVDDSMVLAGATLTVDPGDQQWINWTLPEGIELPQQGYVRFDLLENADVSWHVAGAIEPGHVSAFEMAPGKMRRYSSGVTLALRVDPPQRCFAASNVTSGQTRPHAWTNLWRSDPDLSLPQTLTLTWDEEHAVSVIDLTFAGHLLREYHAYAPFYRDPQCVKDYDVQVDVRGTWQTVLSVRDNYQRLRRHSLFAPVVTSKLRVVVTATNGDPSAAIYEIRVY
ncbi:FAD dependent oxidoreductase [Granulicella pectinivorans]|uniref:FAD dependent oxidoreductase n=1 Tax=Granulicella pectinivorans TaxID=474950 RepID=A0A1I6MDA9_9BACT|nr:FAD-dependent oxidoreductase [Granulicella pectinivorans]SFS13577.1 FAD dependent oxidoreductase [Granulicella pectinivorans]